MPEIPEMKHYKQLLSEAIIGSQIKQVTIQRAKSLNVEAKEFESLLLGEIIAMFRAGQNISFYTFMEVDF
jgi:formamidopyrimidine-DNA glycosylase